MSEIRGRGGGAQHHVLVSSHPVKWSRNMSEIRGEGEGGGGGAQHHVLVSSHPVEWSRNMSEIRGRGGGHSTMCL